MGCALLQLYRFSFKILQNSPSAIFFSKLRRNSTDSGFAHYANFNIMSRSLNIDQFRDRGLVYV